MPRAPYAEERGGKETGERDWSRLADLPYIINSFLDCYKDARGHIAGSSTGVFLASLSNKKKEKWL